MCFQILLVKEQLRKYVIPIFHGLSAELTNRIHTNSPMQHSILSRKPLPYSQPANTSMFRDNFMEPNQLPPQNFNLLIPKMLPSCCTREGSSCSKRPYCSVTINNRNKAQFALNINHFFWSCRSPTPLLILENITNFSIQKASCLIHN